MFKRVTLFILFVLGTLIFALPVMAQGPNYSYVKVINLIIGEQNAAINNVPLTLDQPAYVKDGRTLVPFRFLGEALGAAVTWDNTNKIANLKIGDSEVKVTVGSKTASINGTASVLDVPAEVKGGRTFIPLRFVSEALGASVDYDEETKEVTITSVNTDGWERFTDSNGIALIYPNDWTVDGDTTTNLEIFSPVGTNISIKLIQNETSEIINQEKALHTDDGFQLLREGPIDDNDPGSGQLVIFMKPNLLNMDDSDIIVVIVGDAFDGNLMSFRATSKYLNIFVDFSVVYKMFQEDQFEFYIVKSRNNQTCSYY